MKIKYTIIFLLFCLHVSSQTIPVTFEVQEDQSNKVLSNVKVSIPGISPSEFLITQTDRTFQIRTDEILELESKLKNVKFTKAGYKDEVLPEAFVEVYSDAHNIVRAYMISNATLQKKDNLFVRGTVKSADGLLLENVKVQLNEKNYSTITDKFGYYSLKIPVSSVKNFSSLTISFSGGKKSYPASVSQSIEKSKFDYRLDVKLEKKDTRAFIKGQVIAEKGTPKDINLILTDGTQIFLDTVTNAEGDFGFVIDTVDIPSNTMLAIKASGDGWRDTTRYFQPNQLKGLLQINLVQVKSFVRSPHTVEASFRFFPGITDYETKVSYVYHLPQFNRQVALKGTAGYRYFKEEFEFNVFENSSSSGSANQFSTDTVHQQFESIVIGTGARVYYKPFDINETWNPFAEVDLAFGPKKDFGMFEAGIAGGTMVNLNKFFALSLAAQLNYTVYQHQQPYFNTFSDAQFEKEAAHGVTPFLIFSLQFFPSL